MMADNNEQISADILQCKADILRASNIPVEKEKTAVPEIAEQEKSEIPRFDLAEDIMAGQRKITAIKRKAPGKKNKAQTQEPAVGSISYTIKQPTPALPEQEQIIAEIVARDIERLRRSDARGAQG